MSKTAPKSAAYGGKGAGKGGAVKTDKIEDPQERMEMMMKQRECDMKAMEVQMALRACYSQAATSQHACQLMKTEGGKFEDLLDEIEPCDALLATLQEAMDACKKTGEDMGKAAQNITDPSELDPDMFDEFMPGSIAEQCEQCTGEFTEILETFKAGCMEFVGEKFPDSLEAAQEKIDEKLTEIAATTEANMEAMESDMAQQEEAMQTAIEEDKASMEEHFQNQMEALGEEDDEKKAMAQLEVTAHLAEVDMSVRAQQMQFESQKQEMAYQANSEQEQASFTFYLEMRKLAEKCEDEEKFGAALETFPATAAAGAAAGKAATKTSPKKTRAIIAKNRMPGDTADLEQGGGCGGYCVVQ